MSQRLSHRLEFQRASLSEILAEYALAQKLTGSQHADVAKRMKPLQGLLDQGVDIKLMPGLVRQYRAAIFRFMNESRYLVCEQPINIGQARSELEAVLKIRRNVSVETVQRAKKILADCEKDNGYYDDAHVLTKADTMQFRFYILEMLTIGNLHW